MNLIPVLRFRESSDEIKLAELFMRSLIKKYTSLSNMKNEIKVPATMLLFCIEFELAIDEVLVG